MRNQGQLIIGGLLLLAGLVFFLANFLNLSTWSLCWPVLLILIGVWALVRPRMVWGGAAVNFHPLGDIKRYGEWTLQDEEILMFVGDVRLDFSRAEISPGMRRIRVYGFVGDVDLVAPAEVGVAVSSNAFLTNANLWGHERDVFLSNVYQANQAYDTAESKVLVEAFFFIVDLDVVEV